MTAVVEVPAQWTTSTPKIVVASYVAAAIELERPLKPGDVSACCPAEKLVSWPWSTSPALCCPGCGTLVPVAAPAVTS